MRIVEIDRPGNSLLICIAKFSLSLFSSCCFSSAERFFVVLIQVLLSSKHARWCQSLLIAGCRFSRSLSSLPSFSRLSKVQSTARSLLCPPLVTPYPLSLTEWTFLPLIFTVFGVSAVFASSSSHPHSFSLAPLSLFHFRKDDDLNFLLSGWVEMLRHAVSRVPSTSSAAASLTSVRSASGKSSNWKGPNIVLVDAVSQPSFRSKSK